MDLDLLIVGGGPAGIATALFLCAAAPALRERVAVLEKERYPREKICAGAIGARADRLLASIGVRVDVPSARVCGLSVHTSQGDLQARDPRAMDGIGRVVRRAEFDQAFAEEARARGIRVIEGARVHRVDLDQRGARVHSEAGEIHARALVGADGVGSFVRRALGAPRGRWLAQVIEVDTPEIEGERPRDLLHFDLSDGSFTGYAWDFPTIVDGAPLVCRGLYELRDGSRPAPDSPALDLADRLRARLTRQGLSAEGLRFKRFAERGLSLHEPLARPRALLVGEAAGIDPVLGEGIAQAIFYGAAAGPYLARCLQQGELGFADWPEVLRRSAVGKDIGLRTRGLPWIYGPRRPLLERLVASSPALALAGMRYFAGERVPAGVLARTALDAGRAIASAAREAASEATSCRPWAAWPSRAAAYRRSR